MKVSKKQIQKWREQEMKRSAGHVANNLEADQAWEKLRKKLENDKEMMKAFRRLKDR